MDQALKATLQTVERILAKWPEGYSQREGKEIASKVADIDRTPLRIAVIGPFSSGKSSIANAVIGRAILPTAIQETTATSFLISTVPPTVEEFIETSDGRHVPLEEINRVNTAEYQTVKVHVHSDALPAGFEILDTPGLSSAYEVHEKITIEALNLADVLLLVSDAKQGMSHTMLDFVRQHPAFAAKSYLLLNKADLLPEADRAKVREFNEGVARDLKPAGVLLTSASGEPGIDALRRLLVEELPPRAEALKVETARKRLRALCTGLLGMLKELRDAVRLDTREMDEKIREHTRKREKLLAEVSNRTEDLTAQAKSECRAAVVAFEQRGMALVGKWTERIVKGEPAIGFSAELRSIWEEQARSLEGRIKKLYGNYRADLEGIGVDANLQIPWWTNWIDWAFAALAVLGPLTGGWGNLVEAILGKYVGQFIKGTLVSSTVRNGLQSAVTQWVTQVSQQMESRFADLREGIKRQVRENLEPQLAEVEGLLEDQKAKKEAKKLDVESERKALESDIAEIEKVLSSLGA